jgi:uncharacterized protein (TIGR03083 family)
MDLGDRYLGARGRVRGLVADLDDGTWEQPVPGCPGWTVHDVIAHLVGLTDDGLNGNMEGAPGPAWTAVQVEKRRDVANAAMLAEWDANAEPFAEALTAFDIRPGVLDVLTHEQDLRGALGEPGGDPDDLQWAVDTVLTGLSGRIAAAGLPAVAVRTESGERVLGEGDPALSVRTTDLEVFRLAFGRRSRDQILELDWVGDPSSHVVHLSIFDLHPVALVE